MEKSLSVILLFLAALSAASALKDHHKQQQQHHTLSAKVENRHTAIYFGDSNVTAGKSFFIQCITDGPVEWLKDEEPLQLHMLRHSRDDFNYRQSDERASNSTRVKSTLSVKHALSRHSGDYRCSARHRNFHRLDVSGDRKIELGSLYDPEEDHNEVRDARLQSTVMMLVEEATETAPHPFSLDESREEEKLSKSKMTMISDKIFNFAEADVEAESVPIVVTERSRESLQLAPTDAPTSTTPGVTTHQDQHHNRQAKLQPVYEKGDSKKLFLIGKPLILACNAPDMKQITWMKGDKNVDAIPALNGHYKIIKEEGKFIIEKSREEDAGNYSCNLGSESYPFTVWAQVMVRVPENLYVVEEEKLEIICSTRGTNPEITWFFANSTDAVREELIEDGERIKLEQNEDVDRARLVLMSAKKSDRGTYFCSATSEFMGILSVENVESAGYVRVKDKLAALWPFLGICAEVFILCTIILIYEKRRNKTDLEESDTDQSPDQKNDIKDSDVRQRK